MERDFWLERWARGEIGFHQNEINPYLIRHWHDLRPASGSKVFVPLCGKSRDMLWLHAQGHPVLGVELSDTAAQAFFSESGKSPRITQDARFVRYEADGVTILCGDFFDLDKDDLASVGVVYDRASLVALPPEMRERYAHHLIDRVPAAVQVLLITFDYPQQKMSGPPFAISATDVEALYGEHADICLLSQHDALAQNLRFQEKGIDWMQESIFLLTLRRHL